MSLFQIENNGRLSAVKETPLKLEKDIQKLTEQNLALVFGLEFVCSEFILGNFRIDSLAFDKESSAFVIIEYKRDKNYSVVDQGYTYLSLLLNNKADFILEYNEKMKNTLKKDQVDWSQSRVMFVSPQFTVYQHQAINFRDLPIELWEVKKYHNGTVLFDQIKASGAKESIKTISGKGQELDEVTKEIKVYTEEEHYKKASDEIKELYENVKDAILSLGALEVKPKKYYIAFVGKTNVVDIGIQKNSIKLWINLKKGELEDLRHIAKEVDLTGHWGNGDYEIQINSDENLEYIMSLVKQSLKKNGK